MKVFTVLFLCINSVFAVQHFTCFPADLLSSDRVVISLKNDMDGTLFLTSGIDDWGNQDSSGVMTMTKSKDSTEAQIWVARNTESTFTVQIPNGVIGKNANDVHVILNLNNGKYDITEDLNCYTRMY